MPSGGTPLPEERLWAELALAYRYHGYIRRPTPARRQTADAAEWMVGFVFRSAREVRRLGSLLGQAGFQAGEPARRAGLWTVPVPGLDAVACFTLVGVLARLLPGAAGQPPQTALALRPRS
jgi:hypothetical protein